MSGGTDFSQQDAPQFTGTDLASTNGTSAAPAVTSVSHSFVTADVGNIIQISAGTSWTTGFYQIVSVSAGAATLDRACGSAATLSGGTWAEGGALASLGMVGVGNSVGNSVWVKTGTYLITSATANVSGGCYSSPSQIFMQGYAVSRGDLGAAPTLQASGISTATIITTSTSLQDVRNLIVDGNSLTSIWGFLLQGNGGIYDLLTAKNCTNVGMKALRGLLSRCVASGCTSTGSNAAIIGSCYRCASHNNTGAGFVGSSTGNESMLARCLSWGNSSDGFLLSTLNSAIECTSYGNGGAGFKFIADPAFLSRCAAEANTGAGFNMGGGAHITMLDCASRLNTGGDISGTPYVNANFISATAELFNNAAGQDFGPNATAGGGAAIRGIATAIPGTSSTSFEDIGAVQSQATGGASRGFIIGG